MRFEDMPSLPLHTVGRAELSEAARAAVTQCELQPAATAGQGDVAAAATRALRDWFTGVATALNALATAQDAVE